MAKQLKFISTDDIKDIPDKGVLTYLLHIAQVRLVKYCIFIVDLYTNLVVFWRLQQKKENVPEPVLHCAHEGLEQRGSLPSRQFRYQPNRETYPPH